MSAQIPINLSRMLRQAAHALCVHPLSPTIMMDGLFLQAVNWLKIHTKGDDKASRNKETLRQFTSSVPEAVDNAHTCRDANKYVRICHEVNL